MKMGRRQLVLAALVVALGAAVYLNWALSGSTQLPATDAVTSGKELGETLLVGASSTAAGDTSGDSAVETGASASDYFSQAQLSRQKARDSATELLEKVLTDSQQSDAAKTAAVSQAAVIAQNSLQEDSIENLIKAKGFPDCIVSIQNGQCSIVVKTGTSSSQNDAIIIKDIASDQSGIPYDKIKIVETN